MQQPGKVPGTESGSGIVRLKVKLISGQASSGTPGISASTQPELGKNVALVMPQTLSAPGSVQQGSNGHLVYVVKKDATAEIRPVVVGDYFGKNDIVIVSWLHAGDRVVADGVLKVVPGKPVKIVEPDQAAGAKKAGAPAKPKQ